MTALLPYLTEKIDENNSTMIDRAGVALMVGKRSVICWSEQNRIENWSTNEQTEICYMVEDCILTTFLAFPLVDSPSAVSAIAHGI